MGKSPRDTHGPIVKTGPTAGKNRSRRDSGQWRSRRSDSGKSRKGGCFVTTAVCIYKGLPDDCHELQTLREFRDTILLATDEGRRIVAQYYLVAPRIVDSLSSDADFETVWREIVRTVEAIEKRDYSKAIRLYHNAIRSLQQRAESNG